MRQQDACVRALETAPGVAVEVQPLHPIPQATLQVSTPATAHWGMAHKIVWYSTWCDLVSMKRDHRVGMPPQWVRSTEPPVLRAAHTCGAC